MKSAPVERCVILGGGGHARVLIDSIMESGVVEPYAILDMNPTTWNKTVSDIPIIGDDSLLPEVVKQGVRFFVVGIGSVGAAQARIRLFDLGLSNNLEPLLLIHPSAVYSRWSHIKQGSQLLPNSVVNAGAIIGENVIVNTGSIVEHDCIVENHSHIATGARLASSVVVGSGAHIGAGAIVIQGVKIGSGAIVGAGAVVINDVAPNLTVVGVPARVIETRIDK